MIPQNYEPSQDGFNFDTFLQSDELARIQREVKINVIVRIVSGSISTIFSFIILCVLYRSHDRLSTTQNRLILGLCIADVLSSIPSALGPLMVPKDVGYWVWMARGNRASCNLQGFLTSFGLNSAQLYNASLCLHYLAIVKYEKTDEYIKNRIEPWLHGVSIVCPLAAAIFVVAKKTISPQGTLCSTLYKYLPPHCVGYEDGEVPEGFEIPCGRGEEKDLRVVFIMTATINLTTVVVIMVAMAQIYRAVRANEKKMALYSTRQLKQRIRRRRNSSSVLGSEEGNNGPNGDSGDQRRSLESGITAGNKISSFISSCRVSMTQNRTRSGNSSIKSRAILQRAFAYTAAWLATYLTRMILAVLRLADATPTLALALCANLLVPLQGFFNFIVFIYPKVLEARRSSETWWKAFVTALSSRGSIKITTGGRRKRASISRQRHPQGKKNSTAVQNVIDPISNIVAKELKGYDSEEESHVDFQYPVPKHYLQGRHNEVLSKEASDEHKCADLY